MDEAPKPKGIRLVLTNLIFREPTGGMFSWVLFLLTTGSIVGLALLAGHEFMTQSGFFYFGFLSLGWAESLAELLPKKQWQLAGIIRLLGWICFFVFLGSCIYFLAASR
jgi:hypothetical protein